MVSSFAVHHSYAVNAKEIGLNLKNKVTCFLLIRTSLQFIGFFKKVMTNELARSRKSRIFCKQNTASHRYVLESCRQSSNESQTK